MDYIKQTIDSINQHHRQKLSQDDNLKARLSQESVDLKSLDINNVQRNSYTTIKTCIKNEFIY